MAFSNLIADDLEMVVELDFSFRLARAEDLENLEWFGIFRDHREIILEAYRAQERGENLILLGLHKGRTYSV